MSAYGFVETIGTDQKRRLARFLHLDVRQPHLVLLAIRDGSAMQNRPFVRMLFYMGWKPVITFHQQNGSAPDEGQSNPLMVRMPPPDGFTSYDHEDKGSSNSGREPDAESDR